MRSQHATNALLLTAMAVALASLPGCSGCDNGAITDTGKRDRRPTSGEEVEVVRTPVTPAAFGKITGKIVYDGTPPEMAKLPISASQVGCCQANPENDFENREQQWLVDKNGGVKNAVIFLRPPDGTFFDLPLEHQKTSESVTVDQPYCAFRPHVFLHFPSFYDKSKNEQKPTGQKLIIANGARCDHNFNLIPNSDENRQFGRTLGAGQKETIAQMNPQTKNVTVTCNIHNWMRAYGFVLDHPYAAITKEDGSFVIENAPLGVELYVVGWHEASTPPSSTAASKAPK